MEILVIIFFFQTIDRPVYCDDAGEQNNTEKKAVARKKIILLDVIVHLRYPCIDIEWSMFSSLGVFSLLQE